MNHPEQRREGTTLVSDVILRRISDAQRMESELAVLTTQLLQPNAGGEATERLTKRRQELLVNLPEAAVNNSLVTSPREQAMVRVFSLIRPWQALYLSYMYEGINQKPATPTSRGEIATAALFPGGLGFGGALYDSSGTSSQKWWIHNWRNSAVFPPAPFAGRLYYRFVVTSECHIYRAPVLLGSIRNYVTIGWTANVVSNPLDEWTTWSTVGWPVEVALPTPDLNLGGGVPVTGWIPVTAGERAALGFVYGTIISLADGHVQLSWGNFGTARLRPQGEQLDYQDFGQIEYRFEPDWWLTALVAELELSQE